MSFKEFYEEKVRKLRISGIETTQLEALYAIDGGDLPKYLSSKIKKRSEMYGIPEAKILSAIASNEVAAMSFYKDPVRQRIAEKCQLTYINQSGFLDVKESPQTGLKALRLLDGELVYGEKCGLQYETKAIDFVSKECSHYICAKHTDEEGGAQTNSAQDVKLFLNETQKYVKKYDDDKIFVAILDGDYYERHIEEFNFYRSDRVWVETSDSYIERRELSGKGFFDDICRSNNEF